MNAELSRKRKLSVTYEDAQSSRGPQKDNPFSACAPSKVRKFEVGSKVSLAFQMHDLFYFFRPIFFQSL